jgi:hypothetical protein
VLEIAGDEVRSSCCDRYRWHKFCFPTVLSPAVSKLLTGQDYGGDAKKCMDAVAMMINARLKDAGLL